MGWERRLGRREAALATVGLAVAGASADGAAAQAVGAAAGPADLRLADLYARDGTASALARRLAGQVVTVSGVLVPAPSQAPGWGVLSERRVAPCLLCGLPHDWPRGVAAVQGLEGSATGRVRLTGRLELGTAAAAAEELEGRVTLRAAVAAEG